ncbi:MAG: hypothetical protein CME36_19790 [unclassified Hahellaceae]|nr:hypothetical protein [Hahellaceae bacterium]
MYIKDKGLAAAGLLAVMLSSNSHAVTMQVDFTGLVAHHGDYGVFGYGSTEANPLVSGKISFDYGGAGSPLVTGTTKKYAPGRGINWIDIVFDYPLPFSTLSPSESSIRNSDQLNISSSYQKDFLSLNNSYASQDSQYSFHCSPNQLAATHDWCFNTSLKATFAPGAIDADALAQGQSLINSGATLLRDSYITVALYGNDANGNAYGHDFRINLQSLAGAELDSSITPVPLPAAVWFFLSGMGVLGLSKVKRRRQPAD